MTSRHLKRIAAPKTWKVTRKTHKWIVKPSPGPHRKDRSYPLLILVRDILKQADVAREAKKIIKSGYVLIDGVKRTDPSFPVGLMDVVEIPELELCLRMVPLKGNTIGPIKIPPEEKNLKICRIEGKTTQKKGNIQLNLHDGRNILIRVKDPMKPLEDKYKTFDSLLIEVPSQTILDHLKFSPDAYAQVVEGRHSGIKGIIEEIEPGKKGKVTISCNGEKISTVKTYVFTVGRGKPVLKV